MMKKKHTYTTPTVDALVVQAESVICIVSNNALIYGILDAEGAGAGADAEYHVYGEDY